MLGWILYIQSMFDVRISGGMGTRNQLGNRQFLPYLINFQSSAAHSVYSTLKNN